MLRPWLLPLPVVAEADGQWQVHFTHGLLLPTTYPRINLSRHQVSLRLSVGKALPMGATRQIRVTKGNLDHCHLYIRGHLDFFPSDALGKSRKSGPGRPLTIDFDGLGQVVETDIATDATSGKSRGFLRARKPFRAFYKLHQVKPGDVLTLEKLGERHYRLYVAGPGRLQARASHNTFTTVDLFCGAGGIAEGFRQAGFHCLYGNDINKHAIQTFSANHPHTWADARPVQEVDPADVRRRLGLSPGELSCLVGGPPCQGFSINAPERFLEDERNSLFRHYLRVLDEFRPQTFIMENVPGMLSLGQGAIFRQILGEFQRRGYAVEARVLFAAHYGVPQERWRLIVLGAEGNAPPQHPAPTHFAKGRANFTGSRTLTFQPLPIERSSLCSPVTVGEALSDLPAVAMGCGAEELPYDKPASSDYARNMREGSPIVFNHFAARLAPQNIERMKFVGPGGSWRDIPFDLLPSGMKKARRSDHTKRYGRLLADGLAGTIMTKCDPHWGAVFLPDQDRALTVREAARLQSFPDRYRFFGPRVAQYEQVGNAVPVLMARAIAESVSVHLGARALQEGAA